MADHNRTNSSPLTAEGRHYRTGEPVRVHMSGGTIERVEKLEASGGRMLPWIGPGLVDVQLNGFAGIDLNTLPLSASNVLELTRRLWNEGVTGYCPTVITNSDESIYELVRAIKEACDADPLTRLTVAGIHLEGPFISPEDGARGAHDKRYVCAPDWDKFRRWQEAAGGLIKLLTLSPEWEGAPAFIASCAESGVLVSIGHTAATPEQIREAAAAGARMSTHLGNGAHLMLPRHPNYLWEQLACDELWTGAIADGFHLPDSLLKVYMKVKGERLVLVSDAVYISGLVPGEYETHIGGKVVLTPEGRLHTADNPKILAGSAQLLPFGMRNLVNKGLSSLADTWEMASVRPSRLMGLPTAAGLAAGAPADILVCDWGKDGIAVREVYKDGRPVTSKSGSMPSSQL